MLEPDATTAAADAWSELSTDYFESELPSSLPTNFTLLNVTFGDDDVKNLPGELNMPYAMLESLVAIVAVIGNALVIIVFYRERRLRRRTNYYIVSLALADFLVGLLGIPFAILASIGLPKNLHACLFTISSLVVLCTISIFCLVAVSIDRYWASFSSSKFDSIKVYETNFPFSLLFIRRRFFIRLLTHATFAPKLL